MFGKLNIILVLLLAAMVLVACSEASAPAPTKLPKETEEVVISENVILCGVEVDEYTEKFLVNLDEKTCNSINQVAVEEGDQPLSSYGLEYTMAGVELLFEFSSGNSLELSTEASWTIYCRFGEEYVAHPLGSGFTCDTLPYLESCGITEAEYLWLWGELIEELDRKDTCNQMFDLALSYGKIESISKQVKNNVIHIYYLNKPDGLPYVMDHNGNLYETCPGWDPEANDGIPNCRGG